MVSKKKSSTGKGDLKVVVDLPWDLAPTEGVSSIFGMPRSVMSLSDLPADENSEKILVFIRSPISAIAQIIDQSGNTVDAVAQWKRWAISFLKVHAKLRRKTTIVFLDCLEGLSKEDFTKLSERLGQKVSFSSPSYQTSTATVDNLLLVLAASLIQSDSQLKSLSEEIDASTFGTNNLFKFDNVALAADSIVRRDELNALLYSQIALQSQSIKEISYELAQQSRSKDLLRMQIQRLQEELERQYSQLNSCQSDRDRIISEHVANPSRIKAPIVMVQNTLPLSVRIGAKLGIPKFRRKHRNSSELLVSTAFDHDYYFQQRPDVQEAGLNPILHYLDHGFKEGVSPSHYFDAEWYQNEYADLRETDTNPLLHYLRHGKAEMRRPHPNLEPGTDIRITVQNLLLLQTEIEHINRDRNALFETNQYLRQAGFNASNR